VSKLNSKYKIAIGMSGGVDSSVAAMLLKEQGYDVVGLFLKLWSDPTCEISRENACCDEKALSDARKVAGQLGIPFYVVDARQKFHDEIVEYYLEEYRNLRTPNPCVLCNKKIKFGWMLEFAEKLGCEKVATGHYARIEDSGDLSLPIYHYPLNEKLLNSQINGKCEMENGKIYHLLKGADKLKDQSYFLWQLSQAQLSKIIFSLGEMTKEETKELAKKNNLPVYEKTESQEICFIDSDYRGFLRKHLGEEYFKSGRIVDNHGYTVGRHEGLVNYTIGQRKGINQSKVRKVIKSIKSEEIKPVYVVGFNLEKNELIVGNNDETFKSEMIVGQVNWIEGRKAEGERLKADVKIRYRAEAVPCTITQLPDSSFQILFKDPQRAVTPGQSAVFYDGDEVIGGGIIQS